MRGAMDDGHPISAVDLFAGPGGLGEGFCAPAVHGQPSRFAIRMSIEKDPLAHRTLELRAFFRQFPPGRAPAAYYDYLRGRVTRDELFAAHGEQARAAAVTVLIAPSRKDEDSPQGRRGAKLKDKGYRRRMTVDGAASPQGDR